MKNKSGMAAIAIGCLTATIPTVLLFQAVTFLFLIPLGLGLLCVLMGAFAFRSELALSRHAVWIVILISVVAVGLPFALIVYHDQSGNPITLVIPNGYRGPVRLVIDRRQGVAVPLKDGRFTYHIPHSGTLAIKDDSPFRRWHSLTAAFSDGQKIPINYEENSPADGIKLFDLGSGVKTQNGVKEEYIHYFLGTKEELRMYIDRRHN